MTLRHDVLAICWAVHLGCTTPARLAREWEITRPHASRLLANAAHTGWIGRVAPSHFECALPGGSPRYPKSRDRPRWIADVGHRRRRSPTRRFTWIA